MLVAVSPGAGLLLSDAVRRRHHREQTDESRPDFTREAIKAGFAR
jgi:hypothetical protein